MSSAYGDDIYFLISDSEYESEEIKLEIFEMTEENFEFKEKNHTSKGVVSKMTFNAYAYG